MPDFKDCPGCGYAENSCHCVQRPELLDASAELRLLKLELARIREMLVIDRFDEGCQRRAFLDLASRVLDA